MAASFQGTGDTLVESIRAEQFDKLYQDLGPGDAIAALDRLNKYFAFSEMPVVSSSYWNMAVDPHPDRVDRDKYGQEILRTLAVDMSFLLYRIKDQQE